MEENFSELPEVTAEPQVCKTMADCADEYNWFCEIEEDAEEGTCQHRCLDQEEELIAEPTE